MEFLLSACAFTTPVPRQEDVGIDFFCSLISREGQLLKAGPPFSVQSKSDTEPICYEKEHELAWIQSQENPLFICVADRAALAMDVYSTWNLLCGPLLKEPKRIILAPGIKGYVWPRVNFAEDGTQEIELGPPIARISAAEIFDETKVEQFSLVLREWIALDRTNIVNVRAGMFWVQGPTHYETGRTPDISDGSGGISFYWNPQNLPRCSANLGKVVNALFLIYRDCLQEHERNDKAWSDRIEALRDVVRSHWQLFDQSVRQFLQTNGLKP
ncbi:MAG TPA: hypothetical protein VLY23_05510 [Candidatus Acidoferrum sp.]|nr:hypothetical protein [Candidatus Acidoferrum sp.]